MKLVNQKLFFLGEFLSGVYLAGDSSINLRDKPFGTCGDVLKHFLFWLFVYVSFIGDLSVAKFYFCPGYSWTVFGIYKVFFLWSVYVNIMLENPFFLVPS